MGWGRWLLLGDLGQNIDLAEREEQISRLKRAFTRLNRLSANRATALRRLEQENDDLKLYVAALVRILVRKGIATEDEIRQLVEAIDVKDGVS